MLTSLHISWPLGHFSLNCPCPAWLAPHVHCTFPGLQVTSAWTVPVLHACTLYLSLPPGHFSLNCPCPAWLAPHVHFPGRFSLNCLCPAWLTPHVHCTYTYVSLHVCAECKPILILYGLHKHAYVSIWWYNWLPTNFTWSNVSVVVTHN